MCDAINNYCSSFTTVSKPLKQLIFVFRGTKSGAQLLFEAVQSIRGVKKYGTSGMVNRYFSHALRAIWPGIEIVLKNPDFNTYTATFTGHSLGGALAALAALRTVDEHLRSSDKVKLITFGQPRIADYSLARHYDVAVPYSFRVVNELDIVAHLPSCQKNESYPGKSKPCLAKSGSPYHHGTEVWYPSGMRKGANYRECLGPPEDEDFQCSD
ncbi:unnamed protein product, partial [Gongylonema pulchrum]|uniref:Lipase_3 domain-containing protein n=1 Tax=Gongylonema pulchrum TaxID=637853 RepID=A0A183EIG6_9BILA